MFQYIQPALTGKPIDQARVSLGGKSLKVSLTKMENIYLKDTPFLSSNTMSIADILGVCELMQATLGLGMDVSAEFPKVAKWAKLVRHTLGPELFDDAHKFITKSGVNFQSMKVPTPKL